MGGNCKIVEQVKYQVVKDGMKPTLNTQQKNNQSPKQMNIFKKLKIQASWIFLHVLQFYNHQIYYLNQNGFFHQIQTLQFGFKMQKKQEELNEESSNLEDLSNSISVLQIVRDQKRKKNLSKQNQNKQDIQKQNTFPKNNTLDKFYCEKLCQIKQFQEMVYSPVSLKIKKEFISEVYKGVKYSLKRLKQPSLLLIQQKQVKLKESINSKQKFLLLDLDQTLVYTQKQVWTGEQNNGIAFSINFRPHIFQFLQQMEKYYQVYVFTAGTKSYAQGIVKKINQRKKIIKDFLCREDCFQTKSGNWIKDLRIIKNRELKDIVIVDNKIQSFGFQLNNGIPILQFKGQNDDIELLKLKELLIKLSGVYDVRKYLKEKLKLIQLGNIPRQKMNSYMSNHYDHV